MSSVCDVSKSTAPLAKQAPWWPPGSASGYHALNQGHLAGELIRRTTGKSLTTFIAEEISQPLGADFRLGAAEEDWVRISTLIPPPSLADETGASTQDMQSIGMKTLTNPTPSARKIHPASVWIRYTNYRGSIRTWASVA